MEQRLNVIDCDDGKMWSLREETTAIRYAAARHAATGHVIEVVRMTAEGGEQRLVLPPDAPLARSGSQPEPRALMSPTPLDRNSPGARLLVEMARHALEWEQTVRVIAHTKAGLSDEGIFLEPGQHAEVPVAWAKSLVARGAASYVR